MKDSSSSGDDSDQEGRQQLLQRQAAALERLAVVSDPEYKPRKKAIRNMLGLAFAGCGLLVGSYEFGLFVWDSYQRRCLKENLVEVAREMYEVEGSSAEAADLLKQAGQLGEQDVAVITLSAYIDGMGTVERLINLDRPMNSEDVDAYGHAMGQAVMLERVNPSSPEWAILRGQLALSANEPERAQRFLEQALQMDPDSAFATLRLGLVYERLSASASESVVKEEQFAVAQRLIDRSIKLDPRFKWGHLWKGVLAMEHNRDVKGALESFQTSVTLDPRFAVAWVNIGRAYELAEEWPEAERAYLRALELRPDLHLAMVGLAYVYGAQDRYEIGLRFARRATGTNKGSLKAWTMHGLLAREMAVKVEARDPTAAKEFRAEAIGAYSQALDLEPRDTGAYIERAKLSLLEGQLEQAGEDARIATVFSPEDPYAWNALGCFQAQSGFTDRAVTTFEKVIAIDPTFDAAYLDLARALIKLGQLDRALEQLARGLERSTDEFRDDILLERGKLQEQLGKQAEALEDFMAARKASVESFDAWLCEARVLRSLGRVEESVAAAQEALQLRPGDEAAIKYAR